MVIPFNSGLKQLEYEVWKLNKGYSVGISVQTYAHWNNQQNILRSVRGVTRWECLRETHKSIEFIKWNTNIYKHIKKFFLRHKQAMKIEITFHGEENIREHQDTRQSEIFRIMAIRSCSKRNK